MAIGHLSDSGDLKISICLSLSFLGFDETLNSVRFVEAEKFSVSTNLAKISLRLPYQLPSYSKHVKNVHVRGKC